MAALPFCPNLFNVFASIFLKPDRVESKNKTRGKCFFKCRRRRRWGRAMVAAAAKGHEFRAAAGLLPWGSIRNHWSVEFGVLRRARALLLVFCCCCVETVLFWFASVCSKMMPDSVSRSVASYFWQFQSILGKQKKNAILLFRANNNHSQCLPRRVVGRENPHRKECNFAILECFAHSLKRFSAATLVSKLIIYRIVIKRLARNWKPEFAFARFRSRGWSNITFSRFWERNFAG